MGHATPRQTVFALVVAAAGWGALAACSESEKAPSTSPVVRTGGSAGLGGAGTGGSATGGSATGGAGGESPGNDAPPEWLSQTGLYEADGVTLAPGVELFVPRYPLWTDTAAKARWIALPEGEKIDSSDPDRWVFPVGTRLWKEFVRDDVRVETRLLERRPDGTWWMVAYQWNAEQSDAQARPDGVLDASGTDHDIPSTDQCRACHIQSSARVLGFGALQLAHDEAELSLADLIERDLLTESPEVELDASWGETEQALLGYLHANCGHCHQPTASVYFRTNLELWLPLAALEGTLEETPFYATTVDVPINHEASGPPDAPLRITPGDSTSSALVLRMDQDHRGTSYQMPPLGTELADGDVLSTLIAWIDDLEAP